MKKVSIREAGADDFEFVSGLMSKTLSAFYNDDPADNAQRFFVRSADQYLFIAECGRPTGFVRVKFNKQEQTAKINPLIVSEEYRGNNGIGSELLKHAEDLARSLGARQIYCTVASTNDDTLKFFLKKDFVVAVIALDHCKTGVDEYSLYKYLFNEPNRDLSCVSVVFSRGSIHHNTMQLLFKAKCHERIVGSMCVVVKKGQPIKLKLLYTESDTVFEALVSSASNLLLGGDFGCKLYIQIPPNPQEIAILQRHGWRIEGALPEANSPNNCTLQWGLSVCNTDSP